MERKYKVNRLTTIDLVGEITDSYYTELKQSRQAGKMVAWTSGEAPIELLVAADIPFLHLESFGTYAAARKAIIELKRAAENAGYSPDLCSPIRAVNGLAILIKKKAPVMEEVNLPLPDFIVTPNGCKTQIAWFNSICRLLEVPGFPLDLPLTHNNSELNRAIPYVKQQYEDLISFMEEITGRIFNYDRLKEIMVEVKRATKAHYNSLESSKNIPSPMTAFEAFISLGPMMLLRGQPRSTEFYEKLNEEIGDRLSRSTGSIVDEKYRLYWDNLPIWFKLGSLSEKLADFGANLIASAYTHYAFRYPSEKIDPEHPLESIAERSLLGIRAMSSKFRMDMVAKLIEEYSLDGVLAHSARTCRPYDIGQYDIVREMERKMGVPGVIIDGDPTDPDCYSEAETNARLETFFEILETKKRQ